MLWRQSGVWEERHLVNNLPLLFSLRVPPSSHLAPSPPPRWRLLGKQTPLSPRPLNEEAICSKEQLWSFFCDGQTTSGRRAERAARATPPQTCWGDNPLTTLWPAIYFHWETLKSSKAIFALVSKIRWSLLQRLERSRLVFTLVVRELNLFLSDERLTFDTVSTLHHCSRFGLWRCCCETKIELSFHANDLWSGRSVDSLFVCQELLDI